MQQVSPRLAGIASERVSGMVVPDVEFRAPRAGLAGGLWLQSLSRWAIQVRAEARTFQRSIAAIRVWTGRWRFPVWLA
jgi:hypothetical protein